MPPSGAVLVGSRKGAGNLNQASTIRRHARDRSSVRPGKDGYPENFNGKLRDELVNCRRAVAPENLRQPFRPAIAHQIYMKNWCTRKPPKSF